MKIQIKIIKNSEVEAIFAFKCCCIPDQNLEFQLRNLTDVPIQVNSYCDLIKEDGSTYRINYLFPQGVQTIPPEESLAFYCNMPDSLLQQYSELVFYDVIGERHSTPILKLQNYS